MFLNENGSLHLEEVHLRPAPAATTSVEESLLRTNVEEKEKEHNLEEKDAVEAKYDFWFGKLRVQKSCPSETERCMILEKVFPYH